MASSPTRRVLGVKDANTSLIARTPNSPNKSDIALENKSASTNLLKSPVSKTRIRKDSPQAGQKRNFEDVDRRESGQQQRQLSSENGSEAEVFDASLQSSHDSQSITETNTTSLEASQGPEQPLEPQFELLQEEMSQRTLDKLHAVSLPQNELQPPPNGPKLLTEASLGSGGMSSFINFEDNTSSQGSDGLQPIGAHQAAASKPANSPEASSQPTTSQEDERRRLLEAKASQLRTRLQLAMFKVQSNQTCRPFRQLKRARSNRERSSSPPDFMRPRGKDCSVQRPSFQGEPSLDPVHQSSSILSPESRIAAFRAQATAQNKPSVARLDSLPVPRIQPTTFSARYMVTAPSAKRASGNEDHDDKMDDVQLPSSPPLSRVHSAPGNHAHPDSVEEPTVLRKTPRTPAVMQSVAEMQLSSPPASEVGTEDKEGNERPQAEKKLDKGRKDEMRSLTSSVVKGEAADGLLQLMRGGKDVCGS